MLDAAPTAENLARIAYELLSELLAPPMAIGCDCAGCAFYETPNCWADYPDETGAGKPKGPLGIIAASPAGERRWNDSNTRYRMRPPDPVLRRARRQGPHPAYQAPPEVHQSY